MKCYARALSQGLRMMAGIAIGAWFCANAVAQTHLRVTYLPTLDAVPMFMAMEKGYFKEEGVVVQATPSQGGAAAIPGLMGGAYDITFSNVVSTLLAQQQGFKLRVIAAGTKNDPNVKPVTGLLTRKADGIKSGKDFEGKSIAVNTRNGVIWLFARSWVKKTGGDPSKVMFKEVPFPQMGDALRNKQVDGIFTISPFADFAMKEGDVVRAADPYTEVQPTADIGHFVATEDFFQKNQEATRKFGRALRKGVQYVNANFKAPETQKLISTVTKLAPEVVATLPQMVMPERVYPEEYAKTMALMVDAGLLKSSVDLSSMIDPAQTK
ncbi:ABC transporter substrate-binding protein [Variovorax sp. CCNWLW225]|uniref:ABC transporter substrate-binding protein n=1 Tax=Variovorax sp. CCNWLW225 TaxID=3127462 RepID=UPI00307729CA